MKTMPFEPEMKYPALAAWVEKEFKITVDKVFKLRAKEDSQYITSQGEYDHWVAEEHGTKVYNLWLEVTIKGIKRLK